ncbi:cupin domain-containing protein [Cyclobacterium salsum]|uniref:cupin domain-containing protein n=1 Tax=Cyclobacterium salsum TaxID=2666329 RepID=UPI001391873B|nr:cupin domain-containing protein [Cyclobacterium salsum]
MNSIETLVQKLDLTPHPEGGYFRETYRSAGEIPEAALGSAYTGKRNHSTCIYFLLTSADFSAFHRIKQDEIWHFYDGSPLRLHLLSETGEHSVYRIGRDLAIGEVPQFVVPGGHWFAAEVIGQHSYSLVGCTVAPGFSFADFELASRKALSTRFPEKEEIIRKLTRK